MNSSKTMDRTSKRLARSISQVYLSEQHRKRRLRLEIRTANERRLLEEMARPKFIPPNQKIRLKPPNIRIRRLKQTKSLHNTDQLNEKPTTSNLSSWNRKKTIISNRGKSTQDNSQRDDLVNTCIPEWLSSNEDFIKIYNCRNENIELATVCSTHATYRTECEKETLYNWVRKIEYFSPMPKSVLMDTCDKLLTVRFPQGEQVIRKGEEADCMYIVYTGQLNVVFNTQVIATKVPGEVLGEKALDNGKPRNSDVFSRTDVVLFQLKAADYNTIISNFKEIDKQRNTDFLYSIEFFRGWSYLKLQRMSSYMSVNDYEPGQGNFYLVIYDLNEESNTFYIVKHGTVELQTHVDLCWNNKWPSSNKEWTIRCIKNTFAYPLTSLKPQDFFGYQELLKNAVREAKAVAKTQVKCLVLNRNDFCELFLSKDLERLRKPINQFTKEEIENKVLEQIRKKSEKTQAIKEVLLLDIMKPNGHSPILGSGHRTKRFQLWMDSLEKREKSEKNTLRSCRTTQTFTRAQSFKVRRTCE